jgi:hypothetical protein
MKADVTPGTGKSIDELLPVLQPRGRLAPFHQLARNAALFPQFAAVVAGLRPGMDCWIPFPHLDDFRRFVEAVGLSMRTDCAFRELPSEAHEHVVGIETLCTTYAIGVRLENAGKDDNVHVFVAVNDEVAEQMLACGWYPVVAKNRIFHKPGVDHLAFGRLLGYPPCCVDFFEKSNNWNRTNSYAEAALKTKTGFDHRTNCFGKNLGYSFSFHIPCRFDCAATIEYSVRVAEFLQHTEPEYVAICRELLHKPVLTLNERDVVVLDGTVTGKNRIRYTGLRNLFTTPEAMLKIIRAGNRIEIRGHFVVVFREDELVDTIECRCDEFGPRVPLLLAWT